MITMRICGGLGNQMFQYACGKALAIRNNTELFLDLSWYEESEDRRKFQLDIWNTDFKICQDERWLKLKETTKWQRLKSRMLDNIRVVREKDMQFDRNIPVMYGNVYLTGSFQSEGYFSDIEDIIRKDFTLRSNLVASSEHWADKIRYSTNTVSLHVRRGDYVSVPANLRIYKTLTAQYYKDAVSYLKKLLGEVNIFVFTNDTVWARENLSFDVPTLFVEGNDEDNGYIDMYLMSLCQHNIIANSTFSWWGAWLNANPEKKVITPRKWFNTDELNNNDIIPESWIGMEVI